MSQKSALTQKQVTDLCRRFVDLKHAFHAASARAQLGFLKELRRYQKGPPEPVSLD